MLKTSPSVLAAGLAVAASTRGWPVRRCTQDRGLISIIVNDPANPYWQTEGKVAEATAEGARLHCERRRPQG